MKKGLAVFSGSAVVHKLMQDGVVQLGSGSNLAVVTVSGSVNVTGALTASAANISVGSVANFNSTTLGGILGEISTAAANETAARIAGDEAVQNALNSYTASNNTALAAEISRATGAEATLTTNLAAEVTRATGAEATLTTNLSAEVTRAQAAEGVLAAAITSSNTAISAEVTRATAAESALSGRIDLVSGSLVSEISRAVGAEAGLQTAIDAEKARIDAILSGSSANLDQFKEVVDFFSNLDTTNASSLALSIADINTTASQMRTDFNAYTASNNAALAAEVTRATGVEAGLQSQIDGAQITINGIALDPFAGGSLSVVKGASNNLTVVTSSGNVVVDLASSVTLTGNLSAAQLTASAGLSVAGGASVGGGLTVSSGDMSVSQGAVSVKMSRADAVARGAGSDGDMFYLTDLTDDPTSAFPRGKCWYFKQDGLWFDAPFFNG